MDDLIAAFDVTTGRVEGVVGNTRTEKDFARFLRKLLSTAPTARCMRPVKATGKFSQRWTLRSCGACSFEARARRDDD
jgi:hypothetical protein